MKNSYFLAGRRQRGMSLVEVLVSFVIVSLGVLSLSALLANSARLNKNIEFRSTATLLANDLGDRMRANRAAAVAGNYNRTEAFSATAEAPAATTNCQTSACTAAEMAAQDLVEWRIALHHSLPAGSAYVQYDSADQAVDIWIGWSNPNPAANEQRGGSATVDECPQTFLGSASGDARPRCAYFRVTL